MRPAETKPGKYDHDTAMRMSFKPASNGLSPAELRQSRLLTSLLVILILVGLAGISWSAIIDRPTNPLNHPFYLISMVIIGLFIAAYFISRTRYYQLAAVMTVSSLSVATFAAIIANPGNIEKLAVYFALDMLLASALLNHTGVITLAVGNLVVLALLPTFGVPISQDGLLFSLVFTWIVSFSVVIFSRHRDMIERDRRYELAQSEQRYRDLLETTFEGVVIHDRAIIVEVNRGFAQMMGYSADEMIGMSLYDLAIPGPELEEVTSGNSDGTAHPHEMRGIRKDGAVINAEVVSKPMWYAGGKRWMTAVRDISERKRAEEAERAQLLFAEALNAIATTINNTLDIDEVLDRILKYTGMVVPNDAADIMFVEEGVARVVRSRGYAKYDAQAKIEKMRLSVDETCYLDKIENTGLPLALPDTRSCDGWPSMPGMEWRRSFIGAPIYIDNHLMGFISLFSDEAGTFNDAHAKRLEAFASQVAIAVRNAGLYRELELRSRTLESEVEKRTAELSRSKDRVEAILHNSPDAVLMLDAEGHIETVNPSFRRLFGHICDECPGLSLAEVVEPPYYESVSQAVADICAEAETRRIEVMARREDDELFDAEIALAPMRDDDGVEGLVATIRDISEHKRLARMKDTFLSTAAHELRTPLTSIRGLSEILLMRDLAPQRREHFLQIISDQSVQLTAIIESMLDISKLEAGMTQEIVLGEVDVRGLLDDVLQPFVETAPEHTFVVEGFECAQAVRADAFRLEQVLRNLIANAVKYSPVGSTVWLRSQVRGNYLRISVEDQGIGITREQQEHLFEKFYRAESVASEVTGTGLGLTICKLVVEQHGGDIWVDSEYGRGSTFTFTIPLAAATEEQIISME
jgi:PAS domain S-box-containing protein